MDREQLMEALHIEEGAQLDTVIEKLFCYALIQQGTVVMEEVLRDYRYVKKIIFG